MMSSNSPSMSLIDLPQVLVAHVAGMLSPRDFYCFVLCSRECSSLAVDAVPFVAAKEVARRLCHARHMTSMLCTRCPHLMLPDSFDRIRAFTFRSLQPLLSVHAPSVTEVGTSAFAWCTSLRSVRFSPDLTSVGLGAFMDCHALSTIDLPPSVREISDNTFANCRSLRVISIPGVEIIGKSAFHGCSSLTGVGSPGRLIRLDQDAFRNCSSLVTIDLPASLTKVGFCAFENCPSLGAAMMERVRALNPNAAREASSRMGCASTLNLGSLRALVDSGAD